MPTNKEEYLPPGVGTRTKYVLIYIRGTHSPELLLGKLSLSSHDDQPNPKQILHILNYGQRSLKAGTLLLLPTALLWAGRSPGKSIFQSPPYGQCQLQAWHRGHGHLPSLSPSLSPAKLENHTSLRVSEGRQVGFQHKPRGCRTQQLTWLHAPLPHQVHPSESPGSHLCPPPEPPLLCQGKRGEDKTT